MLLRTLLHGSDEWMKKNEKLVKFDRESNFFFKNCQWLYHIRSN